MNSRKLTVIGGIASLVLAVVLGNMLMNTGDADPLSNSPQVLVSVPVIEGRSDTVQADISFTGRVIPEDRIDVIAEVSGVLLKTGTDFKTGNAFSKGEHLIRIDDREFRTSLMSQRSRFASLISQILPDIRLDYPNEYNAWSDYLNTYSPEKTIRNLPETEDEKFKLFLTSRNVLSEFFAIRQSESRLDKYTINAPFDGVVTRSQISAGTLVRPNQSLGEFIRNDVFEIEASVSVNEIDYIKVGDSVNLQIQRREQNDAVKATIKRINASIDPTTQTVLVYLEVKSGTLLAGEFIRGSIKGRSFRDAMLIPRNIITQDNMIFVVKDSVAHLQPVEVLARLGENIIIRSPGSGSEIINEFRSPVFEGTRVTVLRN
jgi:multidrug efflux pump subunit AcrA (membrane-fusion protein)